MRLNTYISEENNMAPIILDYLEENCQPFLRDLREHFSKRSYNERFLYRCSEREVSHIRSIKRREDRLPMSTPLIFHNMIDEEMEKAFGWKMRSKGVFASGAGWTHDYAGTAYFFFPQGEYKVSYFKGIRDFTLDIAKKLTGERESYALDGFLQYLRKESLDLNPYVRNIMKWLKPKYREGLSNYDLESELTFDCEKFYLISPNYIRRLGKFIYGGD